jgi:hypothetical protein
VDDQQNAHTHGYRSDHGRKLVSPKLMHDLAERGLPKRTVADRDD